jgi:hypothetical protein
MTTENVQAPAQNHTETGAVQDNAETQNENTTAPVENLAGGEEVKTEAPQGAPENYEFALPEGFSLDAEIGDQFSAMARELNLPQEKAQALLDLATQNMQRIVEAQQSAQAQITQQWQEDSRADKEFGGAKLTENLALAERAINQFNPELYNVLEQSGMGNHPEVIRFAYRVGKAIAEDRIETGGGDAPSALAPERVMYPTMYK